MHNVQSHSVQMNSTVYPKKPIPKEIQYTDSGNYMAPLTNIRDETERIEKRRRKTKRRHGRRTKDLLEQQSTACGSESLPSLTTNIRNRRRESLKSVSSLACSKVEEFVQAEHVEILLEYNSATTGQSRDVRPPTLEGEHEISLSALAGLLSAKLVEAVERGHFSFNLPTTENNSKMQQDLNQQNVLPALQKEENK